MITKSSLKTASRSGMYKILFMPILLCCALGGCLHNKDVRRDDLNAWKGVPVEELESHYMFSQIHMVKTLQDSGLEIRDYMNKQGINSCDKYGLINGYMSPENFDAFSNCTSQLIGCDNIFYIRDGKVLKYTPVGLCFTDDTSRP